jgi:hypothetical protein
VTVNRVDFRKPITYALNLLAVTSAVGCERKADAPIEAGVAEAEANANTRAESRQALAAANEQKILARAGDTLERIEAEGPKECPENMVLVEGSYCPEVRQRCLRYMDPPGRYEKFRCAEYAASECLSKERRPLRFCIDRDEYTAPGKELPANYKSFTSATKTCESLGKRVCQESEWVFACEGEEMLPYPYGHKRDPSACNADRTDIVNDAGELRDLRSPADAFPRCASPFGVRNLSGNLEEFVAIDGTRRPAMKGAYWQPSRNYCRAKQTAHDQFYNGAETGFRCCVDAEANSL